MNPECPKCKSHMKQRSSEHGEFYGCSQYPRCKSIVKITVNKTQSWIKEQGLRIWHECREYRTREQTDALVAWRTQLKEVMTTI